MTTTATGALPMPVNGIRRLTGAEAQRRAQALACLRDKSSECQGQIHVNIFFDGTGNNRDWNGTFVTGKKRSTQTQLQRNGHSNVARLYDVRLNEQENGFFGYYVPGVGTPFPEVDDNNQEGDTAGGAAALYGADRINWAVLQIFNAVHRYLKKTDLIPNEEAKSLVKKMSKMSLLEGPLRRALLKAKARSLEDVVKGNQRRVKSINISVFGFSRGAAQARAFVHRLYEIAEVWGNGCGYNVAGVPMQINFLGIFDTVASVGLAGISRVSDGKWDWAAGEMMSIHPEVRQCVHFAALHEQRINFPVDLAASGKEAMYPGMHSDVGGGYSPGSQGKDFTGGKADGTAKLSQIPLIDMHYEALKAGVLLMTIDEIRQNEPYATHFGCHPQLIRDYNAWLTSHGISGGAHLEQIRAHCRQYVAWKGLRLWNGDNSLLKQPCYKQADSEDQIDLANAQRDLAKLVGELSKGKKDMASYRENLSGIADRIDAANKQGQLAFASAPQASPEAYNYAQLPADTGELLNLVLDHAPVPKASVVLFDNYVHDSLAGFYIKKYTELNVPALNTYGYLRYRSVFKIAGKQRQECRDSSSLPPANVPDIGTAFQQMGAAMGGF